MKQPKTQEDQQMASPKLPLTCFFASLSMLVSASALAEISGKEFYMLRCATCHGADGQGTKHQVPALGPALKGNPFVVNGSAAAIRTVIRKGRSGQKRLYDDTYPNMPSFGPEPVPDVDGLVAYLKGDMQK
jgi:mono/diheme cytochrome c family protein